MMSYSSSSVELVYRGQTLGEYLAVAAVRAECQIVYIKRVSLADRRSLLSDGQVRRTGVVVCNAVVLALGLDLVEHRLELADDAHIAVDAQQIVLFIELFLLCQASFCIGIPEYPRSGYNRAVNAFLGSTNCDSWHNVSPFIFKNYFLLISASAGLVHYSDSSDAVRRRFTGRRNAVRYRTLPRAAPHRRWDAGIPCAERRSTRMCLSTIIAQP